MFVVFLWSSSRSLPRLLSVNEPLLYGERRKTRGPRTSPGQMQDHFVSGIIRSESETKTFQNKSNLTSVSVSGGSIIWGKSCLPWGKRRLQICLLSNLPKTKNTYDLKGALDPLIVCTFKVSVLTLQLSQNSGGSRTIFLSMVRSPTIGIDQNLSILIDVFQKVGKHLTGHEQFTHGAKLFFCPYIPYSIDIFTMGSRK